MKLLCWERESAFCKSSYLSDLPSKTTVPFKSGVWVSLLFPRAPTTCLHLRLMMIEASTNIKYLPCGRLCADDVRWLSPSIRDSEGAVLRPVSFPRTSFPFNTVCSLHRVLPHLPLALGPGLHHCNQRTRHPQIHLGEHIATLTDLNSLWPPGGSIGILKNPPENRVWGEPPQTGCLWFQWVKRLIKIKTKTKLLL